MRLSKQREHAQIETDENYHCSMCCEFVNCLVLLICECGTFLDVVDVVLLLVNILNIAKSCICEIRKTVLVVMW